MSSGDTIRIGLSLSREDVDKLIGALEGCAVRRETIATELGDLPDPRRYFEVMADAQLMRSVILNLRKATRDVEAL
jgi:hypothetical protein